MIKKIATIGLLTVSWLGAWAQAVDVTTHRQYLSGTGCDDMVQWDFKCTDGQLRAMDKDWRTILLGVTRFRHLSIWYAFLWQGKS